MLMTDLPYWKINKTISKSVYVTRFVSFFLSCLAMYCNTHILLINRRYDFGKSVYFEIHDFCVFSSICFVKLYFWNCSAKDQVCKLIGVTCSTYRRFTKDKEENTRKWLKKGPQRAKNQNFEKRKKTFFPIALKNIYSKN